MLGYPYLTVPLTPFDKLKVSGKGVPCTQNELLSH